MTFTKKVPGADPNSKLITEPPKEKEAATCCGRKVTTVECISKKTAFTVATIIGSILLVLGLLALAGYFAPAGGNAASLLQKLNTVATFVATKLGSDLFTLAMFATAIGGALTLTGVIGLYIECRRTNAVVDKERQNYEFAIKLAAKSL
jgi:uncharacterized membrane protein YkgB